jgi:hypothetical protein
VLGFASGLPLALTGQAMQAWLTVEGVELATIGFLSLVGLPYTFKFLWAPLMDRFDLPLLGTAARLAGAQRSSPWPARCWRWPPLRATRRPSAPSPCWRWRWPSCRRRAGRGRSTPTATDLLAPAERGIGRVAGR